MEAIVNIKADKTKLFKFSESQLRDNLERINIILRILIELNLITENNKNLTIGETYAEEIINKSLVDFGNNDDDYQSYEEFIASKTWSEYQRLLIMEMARTLMNVSYKYGRKCIESEFSRSRHITNLGFINLAKELQSNPSVLSDALIKEIKAEFPAIINNWYINQLKQAYISSDGVEKNHSQELYNEIYALELEVARIESRKYTKEQKDEKKKEIEENLITTKNKLIMLDKQIKLLKNDIDLSHLHEKSRVLSKEEIDKIKAGEEREFAEFRLKNEKVSLVDKEKSLKDLKDNKSTDRKAIKFYEDDIKATKAFERSFVKSSEEIRQIEKNITDKEHLIKENEETINKNKLNIDAIDFFKKLPSKDRNIYYLKGGIDEIQAKIESVKNDLQELRSKSLKSGDDNKRINEQDNYLKKLEYNMDAIAVALKEDFLSKDLEILIEQKEKLKNKSLALTDEINDAKKELNILKKIDLVLEKSRCFLMQMTLEDKAQELEKLNEQFKLIQAKANHLEKLKKVAYLKDEKEVINQKQELLAERSKLRPIIESYDLKINAIQEQIKEKESELEALKKKLLKNNYSRYEALEKKLKVKSASKEEASEFSNLKKLFTGHAEYSQLLKEKEGLEKQKKVLSAEQNKNAGRMKNIDDQLKGIEEELKKLKEDESKYNSLSKLREDLSSKKAFLEDRENKANSIVHVQCKELIKYQLAYERNNCIAILHQFKSELSAASDMVSALITIANFTGWQSECCSDALKMRMQKVISLEYFLKLKEVRNTIMHNLDSLAAADEMLNPVLTKRVNTIRESLTNVITHMLAQPALITKGTGEAKLRESESLFILASNEFIEQFAVYTVNHKNDKPDFTQQVQIFISSIVLSKEIIQRLHLEMQNDKIADIAAAISYAPDKDDEVDEHKLRLKIKYDGLLQALGQSLGNLQQYDTLLPDIGKMSLEVGEEFERLQDLVPIVKEYRSLRTHNNYTNLELCKDIAYLLKDNNGLIKALDNLVEYIEKNCNQKQREIFIAVKEKVLAIPKDRINQSNCQLI